MTYDNINITLSPRFVKKNIDSKSLPVPQIDEQLYAKYGLSDDEIDFIESHVKAMA